ncbi:hypothetical protein [Parafrigoribacterium mesophilum]|uniref:hypothetical protein n=1 Tax=Parafrigoribacterium mesophilum TaxID=433646 RepID=UPI0031FBB5D4
MKKSTKLIMTGAASLLGVALAAGGAYATTGLSDAPGQLLKISGIAPASSHANQNALANANANAKGLFDSTPKAAETDADADADASTEADTDTSTDTSTPTEVTPVAPRDAAANASTVKGSETGQSVSAWAHEKNSVEVVAPPAAVSLDSGAAVGADVSAEARTKH